MSWQLAAVTLGQRRFYRLLTVAPWRPPIIRNVLLLPPPHRPLPCLRIRRRKRSRRPSTKFAIASARTRTRLKGCSLSAGKRSHGERQAAGGAYREPGGSV